MASRSTTRAGPPIQTIRRTGYDMQALRGAAHGIIERYSEDEPRDEQGRWTDGGGSSGGGSSEKPSGGDKGKGKVSKVIDFNKNGIRLDHDTVTNPAKAEKFLQRWNDRIAEAPEDFKKDFLGGLDGTMKIGYSDTSDKLTVEGQLQDDDGEKIGNYQRNLDLKNNSAYSAY